MENLEKLLDKIQQDGVDKAKQEAKAVLDEARAKARDIVQNATEKADELRSKAEKDAEGFKASAEATVRQAARDILLGVEQDVTKLFSKLLLKDVTAAMEKGDWVAKLAKEAVKTYLKGGEMEVDAGKNLMNTLRAELASEKEIKLITDENTGNGFRIRLEGGRVEHDFTGDAVTAALSELLRPELAALLK